MCLITVRQRLGLEFRTNKQYPYSQQAPGGGGGGYSMYPWLGRCDTAPHTLTLFKTNIADFPTHFKTEFRFLIPCLRRLTQFKTKIGKLIP